MAEQAQRLLLDRFALPSLIVNRRGEVVYCAHGRLGDYVEPPEGRPTAQLVGLVRETDPEVQPLLASPRTLRVQKPFQIDALLQRLASLAALG